MAEANQVHGSPVRIALDLTADDQFRVMLISMLMQHCHPQSLRAMGEAQVMELLGGDIPDRIGAAVVSNLVNRWLVENELVVKELVAERLKAFTANINAVVDSVIGDVTKHQAQVASEQARVAIEKKLDDRMFKPGGFLEKMLIDMVKAEVVPIVQSRVSKIRTGIEMQVNRVVEDATNETIAEVVGPGTG